MTLLPGPSFETVVVEETASTQNLAKQLLGEGRNIGVVIAHHQSAGRGRFDRVWHSERGESLTFTLVYPEAGVTPWLTGMAVACACASAIGCRVQWPNDLTFEGQKLGGILSEVVNGRLLVGVGINLNQTTFAPDIAERATSIRLIRNSDVAYDQVLDEIFSSLASRIRPTEWAEVGWAEFDETPGKKYRLPDGREAVAIRVVEGGSLECNVGGERLQVAAADALG